MKTKKSPASEIAPSFTPDVSAFFNFDSFLTESFNRLEGFGFDPLYCFQQFKEILSKRTTEEIVAASFGLSQVMDSKPVLPWCNTKFRILLCAAIGGALDPIAGFPEPKEYEMFAILGLLLINDRGRVMGAARSSGQIDLKWLAENEAQIWETLAYSMKMSDYWVLLEEASDTIGKTFTFGTAKGRSENMNNASLKKALLLTELRDKVKAAYDLGITQKTNNKYGRWDDLEQPGYDLYNELVASVPVEEGKKLHLNESNGPRTINGWLGKHRKATKKV